jgi:hypothetical protein
VTFSSGEKAIAAGIEQRDSGKDRQSRERAEPCE